MLVAEQRNLYADKRIAFWCDWLGILRAKDCPQSEQRTTSSGHDGGGYRCVSSSSTSRESARDTDHHTGRGNVALGRRWSSHCSSCAGALSAGERGSPRWQTCAGGE